jgi:hypothetical protein
MVPDLDIWRAANLLIEQYGNGAEEEAAKRSYAMVRQRGDPEGERVWLRIKAAIAELLAPPTGTAH